jgi:DNA-binding CsgD family transcriptional regulator
MRRGRPPFPDVLTPREQQVLALLREGLTNDQIAARLGFSESGARYHVSEILSKLGVRSREEAAQWRPGQSVLGVGLLAGLRGFFGAAARSAPFAVIVLAVTLVAALSVGVLLMNSRSGGRADVTLAIDGSNVEASTARLRDLAAEATQNASAVLPGAELVFVAYATPSGLYTFRFSQPGSRAEVSILGPHEGVPGAARWERIEEERPVDSPALLYIDLDSVQHSFEAVSEAAAAASMIADSAENMGLVLFDGEGVLSWTTMARTYPALLTHCRAPDADLSLMACEPPVVQGETVPELTP